MDGHGSLGHDVSHWLATHLPALAYQFVGGVAAAGRDGAGDTAANACSGNGCGSSEEDGRPTAAARSGGVAGSIGSIGSSGSSWLGATSTSRGAADGSWGEAGVPWEEAGSSRGEANIVSLRSLQRQWEQAFAAADQQLNGAGIETRDSGSTCTVAREWAPRVACAARAAGGPRWAAPAPLYEREHRGCLPARVEGGLAAG
jgi:hypothetical protein